ncbi:hypothetical protein RF11_15239 [Thelohanellus kitauei]|uniref:Uncharacterized protein n=1 Tax=Thelohanellus kitauei TaxID=669202 RepID=A0A0C2JC85_THEKT|nr:hypothetical protein RF11_15239 [Thelohanellus kitauei]
MIDSCNQTIKTIGLLSLFSCVKFQERIKYKVDEFVVSRLIQFLEISEFAKLSNDIMNGLTKDEYNSLILADYLAAQCPTVPIHNVHKFTRLVAKLVIYSEVFGKALAKSTTIIQLVNIYNDAKKDILLSMALMEDFANISSNIDCAKVFADSIIVSDVIKELHNAENSFFSSYLKFLTQIISGTFPESSQILDFLICTCIKIEPNTSNWHIIFQIYQSLTFLLTNRQILLHLYTENVDIFNDILFYYKRIVKYVPTNQIGDFYQIYSHLFSEIATDPQISKALQQLYHNLVSNQRLNDLLKSIDCEIQKAGLLLVLTVSTNIWAVDDLANHRMGPLSVLTEPGIFMKNSENLALKDDVLRMYLKNPLFSQKFNQEEKDRMNKILNRGITSQVSVGFQNA